MISTSHQLFNIPELLEVVLLHLPRKDVICLQRLAKSWSTTIQNSYPLQEKLCFASSTTEDASFNTNQSIPPIWNPFLIKFGLVYEGGHVVLPIKYLESKDCPNASWKRMSLVSDPANWIWRLALVGVSVEARVKSQRVLRMGEVLDFVGKNKQFLTPPLPHYLHIAVMYPSLKEFDR